MKPVTPLVRVVYGAHLFGTATPASDQDFKGVHLPSGEAILLQRTEEVIDRNIVAKEGNRNTSEAVDEQSFSLQKFFAMLAKGDTVATEILFALPITSDPRWAAVQTVGQSLLNRQCKGFVGYCTRQAAKYGIKGSRMSAVRQLLTILEDGVIRHGSSARLSIIEPELRAFARIQVHAGWINIPSPAGADQWHIECCDRKTPVTITIKDAHAVYQRVWDTYGDRSRAALVNEGIDWKAISHAVRVARQAIELMQSGRITFPRPDAPELLEIKLGRRSYDEVSVLLEDLVEQVQAASAVSHLPAESNLAHADDIVRQLYLSQIC